MCATSISFSHDVGQGAKFPFLSQETLQAALGRPFGLVTCFDDLTEGCHTPGAGVLLPLSLGCVGMCGASGLLVLRF